MPIYNSPEDITTGTSPLKGVRGSDLYNQDSQEEQAIGKFSSRAQQMLWEAQTGRAGKQYIGSPGFMEGIAVPEGEAGYDYGKSRFDRGVMVAPTQEDIANRRADEQTGVGKLLNGLSKGAVLAGTTFLDGTLGLAFGVVDAAQAAAQGDNDWYARLWDNSVSNGLQKINELSESALPNYRTTQEEQNKWYQNLGTVNFWADSFLKNLGFTVGAFYSGGAFNKLLKGMHLLKSGLGAAVTGSIYSAINEGRIEANNNTDDWKKLQLQQIDDEYSDRMMALYQSGLSESELLREAALLDEQHQKAISDVEDNASAVGLIDLMSNIAILSLTNVLTYGRVYSKGFETAKMNAERLGRNVSRDAQRQAADKALVESEGKSFAKNVRKDGTRYGWNDITKAKSLYNGLRIGVREGNEEMSQAMAAEFAGQIYTPDSPETYYRIGQDDVAEENTNNLFDTLITSFANTYGNGDRWEEFAIGALTGILGMPTFGARANASSDTYLGRHGKIGLTGGLFGELRSAKEMNQQGREAVAKMNEFLDKFEQNKIPFYRRTSLSNAMDGWVAQDNKFEYKNAEDNDMFEQIAYFSKMGKMQDLQELIQDAFFNVTDEQLQSIAMDFSPQGAEQKEGEQTGYRDETGALLSDTEAGRALMREQLKKQGERILDDIDLYNESLEYIRNISGDSLDSAKTTELAWMHFKLGKFDQRYSSLVKENESHLREFVENANARIEVLNPEIESKKASLAAAAEDKKEEIQKELDSLTTERDMLDTLSGFSKRISGAENIRKLLVSMPEKTGEYLGDVFKAMVLLSQDGNIAASAGFMAAIDALEDLPAIIGAWNTFNLTLNEYMKDPSKVDKMHQKVDKEKSEVREEKKKSDVVNKHKGKSAEELANISDEAFAELDNLDVIPDDLQAAKTEAEEIRKNAKAVVSAIDSSEIDDEDKRILGQLAAARTPSERAALLDPDAELSKDEIEAFDVSEALDNFQREFAKDNDGALPTSDELAAEEQRLKEEKARKLLDGIRGDVAQGKEEAKTMPGQKDDSEVKGLPKLTDEQKAEEIKLAHKLGDAYVSTGITPAMREGMFADVVALLEKIRGWKLSGPDNLWAKIHADKTYRDIVGVSEMPALDEAVIGEFLNSKVIFPDSTPESAPVPPSAPKKTPKPSTSPSPSSEQPAAETRQEAEIQGEQGGEVDTETSPENKPKENTELTPFSREFTASGGQLTTDSAGNLVETVDFPGFSDAQNRERKLRRDYLKRVGAFANRYAGLVYPGKEVHFEIRPDAVAMVGTPVILIVDSDGNVLGDMAPKWALADATMKAWVEAKEAEYGSYVERQRSAGQPIDTYTLGETTTIKENTSGKVPYVDLKDGEGKVVRRNLLQIMYVLNAKGDRKAVPFKLATIRSVVPGIGIELNGKNPPAFKQPKVDNLSEDSGPFQKGDVVLLLPSGTWKLSEDGKPEMEYSVVPLAQLDMSFDGSMSNPISRLLAKWVAYARNERDTSKDNSISGSTFADLAKILEHLFAGKNGFRVNPEKIDGVWNVVIERPSQVFSSADDFSGLRKVLTDTIGKTSQEAEDIVEGIKTAKTAQDAREILSGIALPQNLRFTYSKNKGVATVGISENVLAERLDDENFLQKLIGAFTGKSISASYNLLNSSMTTLCAGSFDYNQLIGASLRANIAPGVGRTVNSYFSLNDFNLNAPLPTAVQQRESEQPVLPEVSTEQQPVQPSAATDRRTREELISDIASLLGENGGVFSSVVSSEMTDDQLRLVASNQQNIDRLRDSMERFDEDDDEAAEFVEDFMKGMRALSESEPTPVISREKPEQEPVAEVEQEIGGKKQTYFVSGKVIRNKDGKEVFSKDSKQRRTILLKAYLSQRKAAEVDSRYVTYEGEVYDADGNIIHGRDAVEAARTALVGTPESKYAGRSKFAEDADMSGLIEAAYGWNALSDDERQSLLDSKQLSGLEPESEWAGKSLRDRESALECY